MESPNGSTSTGPAPGTGDVPAAQVDIDSILAEVEALTAKAAATAVAPSAPIDAPAMSKEEADLAALEREIEALISGKGPEPTGASNPASRPESTPESTPDSTPDPTAFAQTFTTTDASSARSVARDALEEASVDPLVAELDAALSDDADALLKRSEGDIDRALATVFDARALGGQEEEINRALIDAFGSSRVQRPSFQPAVVTNPAPKFDGVSREMPATSNPNASTASQAKPRLNPEYAGEKPFEPAFPKIDAIPTAEAPASGNRASGNPALGNPVPMNAAAEAELAVAAATQTSHASAAVAASAVVATTVDLVPDTPIAAPPQGPGFFARMLAHGARILRFVASLPLRACAFPMRFVPDGARTVVGIAAITLVLWTPAAWWFAATRAKAPGVGPVAVVPREAPANADGAASAESSGAAKSDAHAKPASTGH